MTTVLKATRWMVRAPYRKFQEIASNIPVAPQRASDEGIDNVNAVLDAIGMWLAAGLGRADHRLRTYVHDRASGYEADTNENLAVCLFIATTVMALTGLRPIAVMTAVPLLLLFWVDFSTPLPVNRLPHTLMAVFFLIPAAALLGFGNAVVALALLHLAAGVRRGQLRPAGSQTQPKPAVPVV